MLLSSHCALATHGIAKAIAPILDDCFMPAAQYARMLERRAIRPQCSAAVVNADAGAFDRAVLVLS